MTDAGWVTYQVQDEERGQGAVGLDGISCEGTGHLSRATVGFKGHHGTFVGLHQQFHHQAWESLGNLQQHPD